MSAPARNGGLKEPLLAYLYLAPAFVPLAVFVLYPLGAVFVGGFFRGWGTNHASFAGMANFDRALGGVEFWNSLLITIYYAVGTVPAALALSFIIAALLHQQIRARGFYRAAYFLPYVTSTVAAAAVFRWIFSPSERSAGNIVMQWAGLEPQRWTLEQSGILELAARHFGFEGYPPWAGGPSLALCCVMLFSIWHVLGFNIVVFLAGMTAIPRELYEAAEVDGAGWRAKIRHITLPMLTPTLMFLFIVSVIRAFQTFNEIYILTPSQRSISTQNVIMLIVKRVRETPDLGYASAISFILFLMILSLTLLQFRLFERKAHYQ